MHRVVPCVFGGSQPLSGVLTLPERESEYRRGVVICAPLGHENVTTFRPLRTLAKRLADDGAPVLRFDWPGTGDSADRPPDELLDIRSWTDPVREAVGVLQARTGVEEVALVGLRIGATLALLASAGTDAVTEIALLAPFVTGRAYLRELRAFQTLAEQLFVEPDEPPPPLPAGTIESSGFLVLPDEAAAISSVDLRSADLTRTAARRVLVATTHRDPTVSVLVTRLAEAVPDTTDAVLPELSYAWEGTDRSALTQACSELVCSWLASGEPPPPRRPVGSHSDDAEHTLDDGIRESAAVLATGGGQMVVLTCEPVGPPASGDTWVVFLNAGAVRKVGPNRLWTRYARAWAAVGLPSLRIDVWGVGDADGDRWADETPGPHLGRYYSTDRVADVAVALEWLAEQRGARRFALVGLCSGAFLGFHTALSDERVPGIAMINPRTLFWDEEHDLARYTLRAARRIGRSPRSWHKFFRKGAFTRAGDLLRGAGLAIRGQGTERPRGEQIVDALDRLAARGTAVLTVFSEGDDGEEYLTRHLGPDHWSVLRQHAVRVEIVRGPDHTFRPVWSHARLQYLLEDHLRRIGFLPPEEAALDVRAAGREPGAVTQPS